MNASVTLALRLVSAANRREHWRARARRVRTERQYVYVALLALTGSRPQLSTPHTITLTRIGPRTWDDDNCVSGFKAPRDAVAAFLGVDDGSPLLTWVYCQEKGQPRAHGCRIEIREDLPCATQAGHETKPN